MTLNQFKNEIKIIKKSMELIKQTPKNNLTELEMILKEIMSGKSRHNVCLRSTLTRFVFRINTINAENKGSSNKELQELYLKDKGYISSLKRIKTIIQSYIKFVEYAPSNTFKLFLES